MAGTEGLKRTKMCGEFTREDIGSEAVVMGWIAKYRNLGSLFFADVRDRTGIVQISVKDNDELMAVAATLRNEYVVAAKGIVKSRGENVNKNIATGEIEIELTELHVLADAEVTPFAISDSVNANDALKLKYRYLDLRRPIMQKNFIMRDKISRVCRNFLSDNGFMEIETPFLGKSTPEGARDYLVPSRIHPGKFYALPQSPQLFKQLLMISGFDRYYQIARCFRDEDLRANRQPEFTQVDIEMSFVNDENDVMDVAEALIKKIFKECKGIDFTEPFRRMTYREAMTRFGSDKPDTRFGYELKELTDVVKDSGFGVFRDTVAAGGAVRAIVCDGLALKMPRKAIDATVELVKTFGAKGMAWVALKPDGITSSFLKFLTNEEKEAIINRCEAKTGDMIFIVADKSTVVYKALGELRVALARQNGLIPEDSYDILWITEFPMFEYSEEEGRLVACHHPFTCPNAEDFKMVDTDPGSMRSMAYDLVINGQEAGGGSVRIHDRKTQEKMFEILGLTEEDIKRKFGFFVDAFKYGAPPHGGLAFGLDRLVMLLTGAESIKDVIAFPKVQNASCLMSEAPSEVDEKQLRELSLKTDV
ncbi:MAG: aspartate--tRNA ligase [Christensenellales bacterium]